MRIHFKDFLGVLCIVALVLLSPKQVLAGSHVAHFYFVPTKTKIAPGEDVYILVYSSINKGPDGTGSHYNAGGEHPYFGGKFDISYPGATFDFLGVIPAIPENGGYFTDGVIIESITPATTGHTFVQFRQKLKSDGTLRIQGGTNKVAIILHMKAKDSAASTPTPQIITLGPGTVAGRYNDYSFNSSLLYKKSTPSTLTLGRSGGEPHDILQPALIAVTSQTINPPAIPTVIPGDGSPPHPDKVIYNFTPPGSDTITPDVPTLTPTLTPTPTEALPTATLSPTPFYLRSDFGGQGGKDGKIDIQDLNILAGEFYQTLSTYKSNIINTGDSINRVDIQDYNAFVNDYQAYLAR